MGTGVGVSALPSAPKAAKPSQPPTTMKGMASTIESCARGTPRKQRKDDENPHLRGDQQPTNDPLVHVGDAIGRQARAPDRSGALAYPMRARRIDAKGDLFL